ncbi:MAG: hypothetical protein P1P93_04710 [Gammaproteobacteria bacterium]|nr:hypothetical protein [Gammaproteobacteria bacterium]MDT8371465.1 hypothetical protein [Gammaproteobacteria bacterium]
MNAIHSKFLFFGLLLSLHSLCFADSTAIDKVYHPYVQPLEREIELRMISADDEQQYRLGLGSSLSDRLFVEGYLIASNNESSLDAFELEAKYQLTEQGEYAADWGVLVELEKDRHGDNWELATALLMEKEWGRWVNATNLKLIYEWGDDIKAELESALAVQMRYRYSRLFEPALELYSGQNTRALGPVIMGDVRFDAGKKLHWESGVIFGLDSKTPNSTWRFLTEFEF